MVTRSLLGKRGQFLELNGGKIERGSVPSPPSRFAEREAKDEKTSGIHSSGGRIGTSSSGFLRRGGSLGRALTVKPIRGATSGMQ